MPRNPERNQAPPVMERRACERLIDETVEESFPASDPPAWGTAAARLERRRKHAAISGISPFFIVSDVPSALSFYRDKLGFEITFEGPEPDDIFFVIVRRGGA